jgi:glycosyltransferase involved in cell wall biosynthesis
MNDILLNPLVSIVIATYNGERFIAEQLDSILAQTYTPLEIIIVDDCSTDNTAQILKNYVQNYPNILLVINEVNLGFQKNFEKGFLLAKGEYIAPSDQDDIWSPNKIEVLMQEIGDYAIAYCNSEFIDINGEKIGQKMSDIKSFAHFDNPIMFAVGVATPGHAMLIKRQVVLDALPFPSKIMTHDHWLGFVATFNNALKFVNQPLVLYRRHDANVFGALHKKDRKKNDPKSVAQRLNEAQERVRLLYEKCPAELIEAKRFYHALYQSYQNYSLLNNFNRMCLFFKYRQHILAYKNYKKRAALRRWLYCFKTFFKII